ncbi:MAG: carbohydrate binding family 9 domain-containing protein [Candidatus Aminicenantes bacterium]|nr:carbohydrate binding family 9 domain-containing protein [Candidatus Aminicenantes bacterium]
MKLGRFDRRLFMSTGLTILWFGVFISALTAEDQKAEARRYTVKPAVSNIKVDGVLDEPAWSEAEVVKLAYEWTPGDNIIPSVETDFLITFSREKLYFAFRCYDPDPSKIRAHLMDRDNMDRFTQDDHVSIMIDTFNDERRCFQFRINSLGIQADAILSELEGYEDFSWDVIWESAGKITEWGYAVEVAIPFHQLRFPDASRIQTWGISAERSYPRNVRYRICSHRRERDISCILCQFNKVTGFTGMKTGYNIELDPTLTAARTDTRDVLTGGDMEAGKIEVDPGLTARWGITPNLILNAAVNPDFSHVEADVAQLDVNTQFALRYPEKRPFFLEGADFFLTPFEAVFTRTVADPAGGFKLTGKAGKNAFGFIGAYDRINNLVFPANQGSDSTSLEDDVSSGVFRYRRDIGRNSTLGVLYTGRIGEDYYNHVAGADGFFRLSRTKTLRFQYLHSETDYPGAVALDFGQEIKSVGGNAVMAELYHLGRNWQYNFSYTDVSPGFRADYGYLPRVDYRSLFVQGHRLVWGEQGDWFNQLTFGINGTLTYDYDGRLTNRNFMLGVGYAGTLQSSAQVLYAHNRELYQDKAFELDRLALYAEMRPMGGLSFGFSGTLGDDVDYVNARQAYLIQVAPYTEIGLGRHINLSIQHAFQRLTLKGEEIFLANLSQIKLVCNFSVRMFVRAIIQYLNLSRSPELYLSPVPPKTQTVFTQFLFSYKINPQTVFFLGYSDNYLGMTGLDVTQSDRTFFVKIGYAWTR